MKNNVVDTLCCLVFGVCNFSGLPNAQSHNGEHSQSSKLLYQQCHGENSQESIIYILCRLDLFSQYIKIFVMTVWIDHLIKRFIYFGLFIIFDWNKWENKHLLIMASLKLFYRLYWMTESNIQTVNVSIHQMSWKFLICIYIFVLVLTLILAC